MTPREIAEFRADVPYDGVEDEKGFVQFPGRGIADVIAQMCRDMGHRVSETQDEGEHGWTFDVFAPGRRSWFQVTDLGDYCVLATLDRKGFLSVSDVSHEDLLANLDEMMRADPRFSEVKWYTRKDYERPAKAAKVSLGVREFARVSALIVATLFFLGFGVSEFMRALIAFGGRNAVAAGHATAGAALICFAIWGLPLIVRRLH